MPTENAPLLTPRQLEVLELLARGLSNRALAERLGISAATVKTHVSAVIEALDVTNRTEAATALYELGIGRHTGSVDPAHRVDGFGERPAIAVLPFQNFSTDPAQDHLADALVEDLTARLASWRWFPVIGKSSSAAQAGEARDVREASRALGAGFLVEGSVRCAEGRVRITVQLIDGRTGQHAWAERYDRDVGELFEVEDEIVSMLVAKLEPALAKIGGVRVLTRRPRDLGVWECLQRGFLRLTQFTGEARREARALFERAIELDPTLAQGPTGLAFAHVTSLLFQDPEARDRAAVAGCVLELGQRAVALDPHDAVAHFVLGFGHLYSGQPEVAAADYERSAALDPSVVWAHGGLGVALSAQSPPRPVEAEAALRRAIRLSPADPFLPYLLVALGNALSQQGRLEEAIECNERARRAAPTLPVSYGGLAFCRVVTGRVEEARATLRRLLEIHPTYSPIEQARAFVPADTLSLLRDVLASAGWVEPDER